MCTMLVTRIEDLPRLLIIVEIRPTVVLQEPHPIPGRQIDELLDIE